MFVECSVKAERRGDCEGVTEGVGDLVRYGVGGNEVGDAVHVREQMTQVEEWHLFLHKLNKIGGLWAELIAHRAQMMSKFCMVFKARWQDMHLGGIVVAATVLGSCCTCAFGVSKDERVSLRRFWGLATFIAGRRVGEGEDIRVEFQVTIVPSAWGSILVTMLKYKKQKYLKSFAMEVHRTGIEPVPLAYIFHMEGKHDNHFTIGVVNKYKKRASTSRTPSVNPQSGIADFFHLVFLCTHHATLWQGCPSCNQKLYKGLLRHPSKGPRCHLKRPLGTFWNTDE